MVLDATLLNTQHYKLRIKVKWSNPGKGVAPSPTSRCRSYRKGSLRVTLDYGRQLNCNAVLLCISQSSNITDAPRSDCLVSYTGHSLRDSYPSGEMQLVYSTAPKSKIKDFGIKRRKEQKSKEKKREDIRQRKKSAVKKKKEKKKENERK